MRTDGHAERHDKVNGRFFAILRIRLNSDVLTYVARKETGTSTNNITGSRYTLLKPMAFCEQIEFIISYRTYYIYANKCYRNK